MSRRVCCAIMSSSFVRMVHTETGLDSVVMRGPPLLFAAASSSTPSQLASRQTRSRIMAACSPMPPVIPARPGCQCRLAPNQVRVRCDKRRGRSQIEHAAAGSPAACACRSRMGTSITKQWLIRRGPEASILCDRCTHQFVGMYCPSSEFGLGFADQPHGRRRMAMG